MDALKNTCIENNNKALIRRFCAALYDFETERVRQALSDIFLPDAKIQLAYPFENLDGTRELLEVAFMPLNRALPDLERRDTILMAGSNNADDANWVGCCGYYTGTFANPWLNILPTGHQVSMRFHEFFRMEDGKVVEMQALWDIPEMMMQAGSWPMSPGLGREWHVPGPATQDGLFIHSEDTEKKSSSLKLVQDMLTGLGKFDKEGVEGMRLSDYWHPHFSWYGPAGIGTTRGISGFRNWHQIPFLNAMPDRKSNIKNGNIFADGDYVAFTAWPGMSMTITGDGWLGIAPANQKITMRSLDFWRCENGLIRENWVLVDLLDVYHQIGIDVFNRLKEFNKATNLYKIS